ncbi:MAG: NAD(P)/FAD-dependent oxidoreductase [Myxococcota bacterium]
MRVVILGAGVSGHTAALLLRKKLPRAHEVTVVTPNSKWNWIPSNIWVGTGEMQPEQVVFELAPVYAKKGIAFHQAKATELHPEGDATHPRPYVVAEGTGEANRGQRVELEYDFLINATGPRLDFAATPGLGPDGGHSVSVCTYQHAAHASKELDALVEQMKRGEKKTLVVGTGHGTCTCEGAAFEYIFNLEFELRKRGVREQARLVFLTNEAELGDFGVGGLHLEMGGYVTPSRVFTESLFVERGVEWIVGAHVERVAPQKVFYETLDGTHHELDFDFAMLLPPFGGVPLKAFGAKGEDLTSQLFSPRGFMLVDADYRPKPQAEWKPEDWPERYQTPKYKNVFAIGIAFAPPHAISTPRKTPNGTVIAPAPPRTGMPSAIMGRAVAQSIADMILSGATDATRGASMARLGAACVASAGASWLSGTAASMTMFPIVPDFTKYPDSGRDLTHTTGEIGLAGHWIKQLLHHAFLYKAKAKPMWWLIPE